MKKQERHLIMTKAERELILDALYAGYSAFNEWNSPEDYNYGKQLKFKVAIDIVEKLYPND